MPYGLRREIDEAWSGDAPGMPPGWSGPGYMEWNDTSRIFGGRRWHEIGCGELPRYFDPLTMLMAEEALPYFGAGYYLATYMACLFGLEGRDQEWVVTHIEDFLDVAAESPEKYGLTPNRCRAIAHFLELKREDFEWWDIEIADTWIALAAALPQDRT